MLWSVSTFSLRSDRLTPTPVGLGRQSPQGLKFLRVRITILAYSARLGSPKVPDSRKKGPACAGPHLRTGQIPTRRFHRERPAGRQREEGCAAGGARVRCSPAAPQAPGRRMRGAGRGVVNGAFCLLEFGAGGRERRRGGADGGGADGPARWAVRGSGGGGGRGRRVLCPRGL